MSMPGASADLTDKSDISILRMGELNFLKNIVT